LQKKRIALTQFERAGRLREALQGKPEDRRTKRDYMRVIDAYRKVYYTAPTSSRADASVQSVAELMVQYGRQFDDEKSLHAAIGQYEFLRREYPGSRFRFEALFTIGEIYRDDLNDDAHAKLTFTEFLRRYPRQELAQKAREALASIATDEKLPKGKKQKRESAKAQEEKAVPQKPAHSEARIEARDETPSSKADAGLPEPAPTAADVEPVSAAHAKLPLVTSIRYWTTPDYTRVAIDLDQQVKYEAGRVPSPDRIFFDLHDTKLASELVGKSFEVGDGFLKKIRVAQYTPSLTRVVLEVDNLAEYSAFMLPNPYRLIIDIHGKQAVKSAVAKNDESDVAAPQTHQIGPPYTPPSTQTEAANHEAPHVPEPPKVETSKPVAAADSEADDEVAQPDATKELTEVASASKPQIKDQEVKSTSKPTTAPSFDKVSPRKASAKDTYAENFHVAEPTSNGDRSLIRALGLKVGRIVVDAGHGGHDTGTIGPHGLLEKDLVLDVSLRLGKLLEQKLGAEVIYTRDDDTFVPLETRTAIANKHQADLFISVHANSSSDESARGVETYYLNFTSDPEALETAARENSVSQKSVFELSDLVKKIALKEKIEESREFAQDVDKSLHKGLAAKSPAIKDRGVKKAPFVVLIGANMPSILAEISFVSNPKDEKLLKTPEYRQRIAEALYRGVARYANSLSGVKVASRQTGNTGE